MVNKKFLIIGLGAVASVAIVATPLAIVSKLTYKGDSIKNVQDALNKIVNVSFQTGDGDGKINNNVSYSRLKSFYFDSNNKPNSKFVVSNFDFFEQKGDQLEKIDDKSFGNFKIVADDLQANDTDKNFTIFYHVEATQPNEFGQIVKSEIHKSNLNFGVVPQFLLATEAHSKLAEFKKAITTSQAFDATDGSGIAISPLNPYTIQQFKASVEKDANTVIRPLALVSESSFINDINTANSSDQAIHLLSKYFNFQDVFGQILKNGDYKFSLVKNPNLSQKPGEGEYVTKVNDAGKSLFRLYLKTEFSDEYKASHQHLPELNAAHIDIINFDLSNDKFKDLFLKPNFTSDWTVKTPTKDDYYTTKPTIDQAVTQQLSNVQSTATTNGQTTSSQTPGQQQSGSASSVTTTADVTTTNGAANPSTSTTSDTTDESKVDSSQINVFDFLSHINGTFFATKEERNKFVTSYINSMLKNGLKPSYQGQNEGLKSLSEQEKDLLFNYNVEVDADSLTLAYDDKEQKPVIKGRLTYIVTGKPTNPEVKEKGQTPLQGSTSLFELDNFKPFEVESTDTTTTKTQSTTTKVDDTFKYIEFKAPESFKDFLFENNVDYNSVDGQVKDKLLLSELRNAYITNNDEKIYQLLSNPNYYGLVLNSARKLDAITKDFDVPSIDAIPYTFKEATSKENIKNNVLNIDSKIFRNDSDVVRFYFALEKQGFTKVAQYLFDILKSTGNIPADSQLDINKPIFEQLSKISLIKQGDLGFDTLSFGNNYQFEVDGDSTTSSQNLSLDKNGLPSQTFENQSGDDDLLDISSLSAAYVDPTISQQIQENQLTSDSDVLKLVKKSSPYFADSSTVKFQSVADVLIAFYTKLYELTNQGSLPLSKINGNLGYKLEFQVAKPDDIKKLVDFDQNKDDISKLEIKYRYSVGFVDPKNPSAIKHELFKTSFQSLNEISLHNDVKTASNGSSILEKKIDSIPDYYKTFYLPTEDYENLGAKLVLRYANRKIPRMSVEDLLTELNAPWIENYYKNLFGKDVRFWVLNGFVPDYSSLSSSTETSSEDELDAELIKSINPHASVTDDHKYTISSDVAKEANLENKQIEIKVKNEDEAKLVQTFNTTSSNKDNKNKFKENYKTIRLYVQSGKKLSDKPLIIRVYEQK
ncbi:P97 family adhesin [Mesomycoplasma bovoculi]|uniref:p97/LppS family protein n=1 Tax=Mesomycoplasma bovoculi M165/69 TaxID=743966 RepID=W5UTR3_9BACT|nr:hypothetical protein [Mesomycoplasma bovoculi]AHH45481.1 P97/LppS family protein [Mesomycoplasma bovoculi M165/69]